MKQHTLDGAVGVQLLNYTAGMKGIPAVDLPLVGFVVLGDEINVIGAGANWLHGYDQIRKMCLSWLAGASV